MAFGYENHFYGSLSRLIYNKVALKIKNYKNEYILDLGCGEGFFLEILKEFRSRLYGADISPEMIKCSERRIGNYAELKVADSEDLPWGNNAFDVIVCILSFHHYPDPGKSLDEMKRLLKNNGHIIIAELWYPQPFRYLTNLYMTSRFNRTGDVKVYSISEWYHILETAGFINMEIEKSKGSFVIVSAEIAKQ